MAAKTPFEGMSQQQRRFTAHVLDGVAPKRAAELVGYQNGNVGAWQLLHKPQVRDALHQGFVTRLAGEAVPKALHTLIRCLDAAKDADKLKAADIILKYYKDFAPQGVEGLEGLTLQELEQVRATLEAQLKNVTPAPPMIEADATLFA